MDITALTSIAANISNANATALEMGEAQVIIAPTQTNKGKCLVVFVNHQAVYSPIATGCMDTYTNCAEELAHYINSY